jgi:hypothetical protein
VFNNEAYDVIKQNLNNISDLDEKKLKSFINAVEYSSAIKARKAIGVEDQSLQSLQIDDVDYSLNKSQIKIRENLINSYIRKERSSGKFNNKFKEARLSDKVIGTQQEKEQMLMQAAKEYATREMKEKYKKRVSELEVSTK